MLRHYTLTLSGSAQRLSVVLPNTDLEPFQQQISIQPNGDNALPVYLGGEGLTDSDYGVRLEAGNDDNVPPAPFLISDMFGPTGAKLSSIYVLGAFGERVHVLCNPSS